VQVYKEESEKDINLIIIELFEDLFRTVISRVVKPEEKASKI
jgi:hypothetical protein